MGGVKLMDVTPEDTQLFREKFRMDSSSPILLVQAFTANALKVQGLKIVIRSLKLLKVQYPNITLIVTRDGIYSNELIDFTRSEGISDSVIFTGDVQNPFVPIAICDIFIFPWLGKSGVGLALLEGMAWGKPVVVTDAGGVSEVVNDGENGLLVVPEGTQIAIKIDYLLKNQKYAGEMGGRAKRKMEDNFTWEQAAERYLSIIGA